MTGARQNATESQQFIADVYNTIGKELGAIVVPAVTGNDEALLHRLAPFLLAGLQSPGPENAA